MLAIEKSRISRSAEFPVALDAVLKDEGAVLVADYSSGSLMNVRPSSGVADEQFVGVGLATIMTIDTLPYVEKFTVTADQLKFPLSSTPLPGTIRVLDEEGDVVTTATPVAVDKFALLGNVIEFHVDNVDAVFEVTYEGRPTVAEVRNLQGDVAPGHPISTELGQTGVIQGGVVYTSMWDTTVAWAGDSIVKLGADGKFTTEGDGTTVQCLIVELPSSDSALLGLSFNV